MADVADVYADELDAIEVCGPNVRLVYVTYENGQKRVVAKLIRPMCSLGALDTNCARLRSLLLTAKANHVSAPDLH